MTRKGRAAALAFASLALLGAGDGSAQPAAQAPKGPIRMARDSDAVRGLAIDGAHVYYSAGLTFAVPHGATDGHGRDLGLWPKCGHPWRIAVDAGHVYCLGEGHGELWRVAKGGGAPTQIAWLDKGHAYRVGGLGVDGAHVYFADTFGNKIVRVRTTGGPVETLYTDPEERYPGPIALDAQHVYWVNHRDGSVMKLPKARGSAQLLGTGRGRSFGVAVDAASVYFSDYDAGAVWRVPIQGGPAVALARGIGGPSGVAVDASHVYFTATLDGAVSRVPKGGGNVEPIAGGQERPSEIAVDAAQVYWLDVGTGKEGRVMRARKP